MTVPRGNIPAAQLFRQAVALHVRGELAAAEQLYQALLGTHPSHADALHYLGLLRFQQGKAEDAVRLIQRALRQNRNSPEAHVNLATALASLGRHTEAIASFQ